MQAYLREQGWAGNTIPFSRGGEMELAVSRKYGEIVAGATGRQGGGPASGATGGEPLTIDRIGIVAMSEKGGGVALWPQTVTDDLKSPRLSMGFLAKSAAFSTVDWAAWPGEAPKN